MKNTLLKSLIQDNRYTYKEIGDIAGISKLAVWMIANGEEKPSYDTAIILSYIFALKPDEIFYDERVIELQDKLIDIKNRKKNYK